MEITILGMGPSRVDCKFDGEVWGVNNGYRQVISLKGHVNKLFICHRDQEYDWDGDPVFSWEEQNTLVENGVEIVSLFKLKHVEKFTRMPFKKMCERFGTDYYSDSIAYMVAYALYLNTKIDKATGLMKLIEPMRLRFYGCDMHTKDEYATERGGIEYYIAVARTLGVEVWIHPDSSICKTDTGKPYGFFKLNKKKIDPNNIMELQNSVKGLRKLFKLGIIDKVQLAEMTKVLNDRTS
jgi:hypothetical protein